MDAVQIEDVTKTFETVTAVSGLTLAVPEGSVSGFIGPNGSGKTTTLRMIVNILRPDCGSIRDIGAEVNTWLRRFDLESYAEQRLETLSKGMSQKVQFIAAVVPQPRLLILDEPFTGLDPISADSLRAAILDLRRRGVTIILSTHDMHLAETMCDSIFMIFRGKKVLDGSLAAIQDRYPNDTIRVTAEGGAARIDGLPGIEAVRDLGQVQELRMTPGCDPQHVLRALVARTRISNFAVTRPSLHDIFVRIAGPAAEEEAVHAWHVA